MQNKKSREENVTKVAQNLRNFIWLDLFPRAAFSAFNVFRSSFFNPLEMEFWMKTYPFGSSHQEVFFRISALRFWAKRLKVTGEGVRFSVYSESSFSTQAADFRAGTLLKMNCFADICQRHFWSFI